MEAKGVAYDVDLAELARRVEEAWERGATEVCMQGGIDGRYDGSSNASNPSPKGIHRISSSSEPEGGGRTSPACHDSCAARSVRA